MPDPTIPPKKKKPAPAAPPRRPADADPTVSSADFDSQLAASVSQPEQATTPETPTPEPTEHPVQSFWDRLVHGADGEGSRIAEAARGAARGVVNAGREAVTTLQEGVAATGLPELVPKGLMPASAGQSVVSNGTVEHYLGKRSDDPLASFTESAMQFATGWAATGQLKAKSLVNLLARGAVADASVFNPREAQLAELAAKAPVPILKQLGEVLSVKDDDSQAVARLKRAAAGIVPVTAIESLVAGARVLRGLRTGDQALVEESAKTLQNVADANPSLAASDQVAVKPTGDGNYTLEAPEKQHVFTDWEAEERRVDPSPNREVWTQEQRDAYHAEQMDKYNNFDRMSKPVHPDEMQAQIEAAPKFPSRAEAEQQAETINNALTERNNVGKVDPEAAARVEEAAKTVGADNGKALAEAMDKPDLNVSIHNTVEDHLKLINDLSTKLATGIRQSVEGNGQVSVEDAFGMARKALGNIPEAQAPDLLTKRLGDFEGQSAWNVASNMVMKDLGQKIAKMSEVLDARPHDPVIVSEARDAVMNYFKLRDGIYGAESDAARTLRFVQEKNNPLSKEFKFADGNGEPAPAGTTAVEDVAGLKTRDASQQALDDANVRVTARMIRMAGGEPRNMEAVINGSKVFQNTGMMSKAIEVFTNFLLSGPKTWFTVPTSGATVTLFEPVARMAAGLATGNRALAQEGADIMWANFKYVNDNLGIAAQAMREGRSIINPAPQHIAIGGLTGQVIRTPSRILTALDELTRVSNYRAFVRAKSLRIGREQGLTGAALEARADVDVRAAFDPETGIATIPDALKYADVPTFSGPLGKDTFGGKFHEFTNNAIEAKFIAPFIKASVNIFRYVWKSTPGLNLLNKQARSVIEAGGEEAAVLHARSAIAGSIYAAGLYHALAGNLTGRGPTDPDLRKLWLDGENGAGRQPYSLRVGGEWVSYRRMDPLATPLGLIADASTFIGELGQKDKDAEDYAYALVSSIVANLGSKTYTQGITEFAQAWGAGDQQKVKQWVQNFAGNLAVPQIVSSFNDDPYYREVRTMGDAIMSRVPGFSDKLDPRYNIFGEKTLKAPWLLNRAMNVATLKPVGKPSVSDDLLALNKGLATMPQKLQGFIDLSDKQEFDNGTHVSPYSRIMALVRKPEDGSPSLRDAMTDLVKSDKWKQASDGVTLIPGGARWIYAAAIKDKYEQKALKQTLEEYPKLRVKYEGIQRLKGAAITGGEAGVADVEAMFGVKLQK